MLRVLSILSISGFAGAMVGYAFFKNVKSKIVFFDELIDYCNYLINDIGFRQQFIKDLTIQYMEKCNSVLKNTLKEYLNYLEGKEFTLNSYRGKKEELALVKEFFLSIGYTDAETQLKELEHYKERFTGCLKKHENVMNTFGKNFVKLGFLFGLIFGLLIV